MRNGETINVQVTDTAPPRYLPVTLPGGETVQAVSFYADADGARIVLPGKAANGATDITLAFCGEREAQGE